MVIDLANHLMLLFRTDVDEVVDLVSLAGEKKEFDNLTKVGFDPAGG